MGIVTKESARQTQSDDGDTYDGPLQRFSKGSETLLQNESTGDGVRSRERNIATGPHYTAIDTYQRTATRLVQSGTQWTYSLASSVKNRINKRKYRTCCNRLEHAAANS